MKRHFFLPSALLALLAFVMLTSAIPPAHAQLITPAWTNAFELPIEHPSLITYRRQQAESYLQSQIDAWAATAGANFMVAAQQAATREPDPNKNVFEMIKLLEQADYARSTKSIHRAAETAISKQLKAYTGKHFATIPETITPNAQHGYQMRVCALLSKTFPQRFPKAEKWLREMWDLLMDSDSYEVENTAAHVDGLSSIFHTAILMGWEKKLAKQDSIREQVTLYRDMVLPNGAVPTYGSAAVTERIYDWPFLMEAAGLVYRDPTFQYVADKIMLYQKHCPNSHSTFPRPQMHRNLPRKLIARIRPIPPKTRSFVFQKPEEMLHPNAEKDTGRPSKLVLRTGHHPTSAYFFMDLGTGPGSYLDQRQSVDGYAAGGVVHTAGWNRRFLAQESTGLFAAKSKKVKFPMLREEYLTAEYTGYEYAGPEEEELARPWRVFSKETDGSTIGIGKISVEDTRTDASAIIEFNTYGDERAKARKHIVLTAEGILIIRDDYTAASSTSGGFAGSIWYQYPLDATFAKSGPDWILQPSQSLTAPLPGKQIYRNALFVKHGLAPGQKVIRGINYTCAAQPIRRTGEKITFLTVAVPINAKESVEEIAKSVQTIVRPGNLVALRMKRGSKHMTTVTIDNKGTWSVKRSPGSIKLMQPEPIELAGNAANPANPNNSGVAKPGAAPAKATGGPAKATGGPANLVGEKIELTDELIADTDQRLIEFGAENKEIFVGKPFVLKGAQVVILGFDPEAKTIRCRMGNRNGALPVDKIPGPDKGRLAMAGAKALIYNKEVNRLAAFYLIQAGRTAESVPYLKKASDQANDLKDLVGLKEDGH